MTTKIRKAWDRSCVPRVTMLAVGSAGGPESLTQRPRNGRTWRSLAVMIVLAASVAVVWPSSSASAATSTSLTRYPYVTDVVGNSARVNWGTDTSQSTGSVLWGAVSGGTCAPTNSVAATRVSVTVAEERVPVDGTDRLSLRGDLLLPGESWAPPTYSAPTRRRR